MITAACHYQTIFRLLCGAAVLAAALLSAGGPGPSLDLHFHVEVPDPFQEADDQNRRERSEDGDSRPSDSAGGQDDRGRDWIG